MSEKKFKSCYYLEKSLIFTPRKLKFCCICQNEEPNPLTYGNVSENAISVENIEKVQKELREIFNNPEKLKNHYCANCSHLQEKEWDNSKIGEIGISPSDICQLECTYCRSREFLSKDMEPEYEILPILKELIEKDMLEKDCHLVWNGGEPTILKEFNEAINYMIDHGYTNNEILTNAVKFSPTVYEHLNPNSRLRIVTSVDAGTRETYKKVKRRDLFDKVWENLEKYAENGGDVTAKYIFTDGNTSKEDMEGFVEHCVKAKIKKCFVDIDRCYAMDKYEKEFLKSFKYLLKLLAKKEIYVYCGIYCVQEAPIFKKMNTYYKKQLLAQLYKQYFYYKFKYIKTNEQCHKDTYRYYRTYIRNLRSEK